MDAARTEGGAGLPAAWKSCLTALASGCVLSRGESPSALDPWRRSRGTERRARAQGRQVEWVRIFSMSTTSPSDPTATAALPVPPAPSFRARRRRGPGSRGRVLRVHRLGGSGREHGSNSPARRPDAHRLGQRAARDAALLRRPVGRGRAPRRRARGREDRRGRSARPLGRARRTPDERGHVTLDAAVMRTGRPTTRARSPASRTSCTPPRSRASSWSGPITA